jgi:hypothetical protein
MDGYRRCARELEESATSSSERIRNEVYAHFAIHFGTQMTFQTEQLLVAEFVASLASCNTPWGQVQFACEFDYSRGRTDVVVLHESGAGPDVGGSCSLLAVPSAGKLPKS